MYTNNTNIVQTAVWHRYTSLEDEKMMS